MPGWTLQPGLIGTSALHALTAGAMGTIVLAVMTRASRGHTGRPLTCDVPRPLLFAALSLVVACRLAAPLAPALYLPLMGAAALAFAGFALVYTPHATGPAGGLMAWATGTPRLRSDLSA